MRNSGRKKGISISAAIILMLAVALVSGFLVYAWQNPALVGIGSNTGKQAGKKTLRENVQARADAVLHALKSEDMKTLSEYADPDKGIRFTPYSYVNTDKDVVIPASQVQNLMSDGTKRLWGAYDGSGEPIELTFRDYYKKFVYDKDFLNAPEIAFNEALQRGNSINNIKEAYPKAVSIEYYYPGFEKKYNGMDWRSISLVFVQKDSVWYLTGITHGQWTI